MEIYIVLHGKSNPNSFFIVPENVSLIFQSAYGTSTKAVELHSLNTRSDVRELQSNPGVIVNNLVLTAGAAENVFSVMGVFLASKKGHKVVNTQNALNPIANIYRAFKNDIFGWKKYFTVYMSGKTLYLANIVRDLRKKFGRDLPLYITVFSCRPRTQFICANKLPYIDERLATRNEKVCDATLVWDGYSYTFRSHAVFMKDIHEKFRKDRTNMQYALLDPRTRLAQVVLGKIFNRVSLPFFVTVTFKNKNKFFMYPDRTNQNASLWKKLIRSSQLMRVESSMYKRFPYSDAVMDVMILYFSKDVPNHNAYTLTLTNCRQSAIVSEQTKHWKIYRDKKLRSIESSMQKTNVIKIIPYFMDILHIKFTLPAWKTFQDELRKLVTYMEKYKNDTDRPYPIDTSFVCMFYILYDIILSKDPIEKVSEIIDIQDKLIQKHAKSSFFSFLRNNKFKTAFDTLEMLREFREKLLAM